MGGRLNLSICPCTSYTYGSGAGLKGPINHFLVESRALFTIRRSRTPYVLEEVGLELLIRVVGGWFPLSLSEGLHFIIIGLHPLYRSVIIASCFLSTSCFMFTSCLYAIKH